MNIHVHVRENINICVVGANKYAYKYRTAKINHIMYFWVNFKFLVYFSKLFSIPGTFSKPHPLSWARGTSFQGSSCHFYLKLGSPEFRELILGHIYSIPQFLQTNKMLLSKNTLGVLFRCHGSAVDLPWFSELHPITTALVGCCCLPNCESMQCCALTVRLWL